MNRLSHIDMYSSFMPGSFMPGTVGTVICPLTTDRRCNRRAIALCGADASTERVVGYLSVDTLGKAPQPRTTIARRQVQRSCVRRSPTG